MPNGKRQKQMYASWVHGNAIIHRYVLFVITFLTVASLLIVRADAATIDGKATFVGTMEEVPDGDGFHAVFHVRVHGTCKPIVPVNWETKKTDYWLEVKSGRMDGKTPHNGPNLINAYSTLLTAFTSNKNVEIIGVNHCQVDGQALSESLWRLRIGIHK
jgi:hypothetical protein